MTSKDFDLTTKAIHGEIQICNKLQSVFPDTSLEPSKAKRFSVVIVTAENDEYRFAQFLRLFQLKVAGGSTCTDQYSFVQYIDITIPNEEVDRALNCFFLLWSAKDEIDHTLDFNSTSRNTVEIEVWYDPLPLALVASVYHVVRSNYAMRQLSLFLQNVPGLRTGST